MTCKRIFLFPVLCLLIFCGSAARAQARFAVYGTVGGEKSGLANDGWSTAGTVGLYVGVAKFGPLYFSGDARADLSSNIRSGLVGPRLALKLPVIPLKPYAEILIGGTSYGTTNAGLKPPSEFVSRAVFGADTTIFPHLDWRIVDFSYGLNDSSNGDHAKTISTGLVVRF